MFKIDLTATKLLGYLNIIALYVSHTYLMTFFWAENIGKILTLPPMSMLNTKSNFIIRNPIMSEVK
jgi:uncharacterized membrane protein